MEGWTDLHCHILPAVDDGPPTPEDGAALVSGLCSLGFRRFVATPHVRPPRWNPSLNDMHNARDALLPLLPADGSVHVELGAENFFDDQAWRLFQGGDLIRFPGDKAVLLEFAPEHSAIPYGVEDRFFQMALAGLRPVVAHPERQARLARDQDFLHKLVGQDRTLLLVSLTSLGKRDGGTVRRAATRLITSEYPVAVASDAHRLEDLRFIKRGLKRLEKLVGSEGMTEMLIDIPASLLNGGR